ncbi:hypothetical protein CBR_g30695 [Chara braunii]|uniref:Thioredoxin domain-containing protein n=1 Tax=Chara braunii TaxID=69332 RepID=A0A388LDH7_CHABU|nr:hypothetical protein CBR_g30695 [Chara braunii]|eukprot:GBG80327.1 hypothetical protein CBR_g30695 [Chara braunii]
MAASCQFAKEVCVKTLNSSMLHASGTNRQCPEQLGSIRQSKIVSRQHGAQGERVQCRDANITDVAQRKHLPHGPHGPHGQRRLMIQFSGSMRKSSVTRERRSRVGARPPLEKNGRSSWVAGRALKEDDAVAEVFRVGEENQEIKSGCATTTTTTTTECGRQSEADGDGADGPGRVVSASDGQSEREEKEVVGEVVGYPLPKQFNVDDDSSSPMATQGSNRTIALISAGLSAGLFMATRLAGAGPDLSTLEKSSLPFEYAMSNGRPTMVEFYADWCEVCRTMAKDVFAIEEKYKDDVNFVMLNIDNVKWAEEVDEFGVEGIPHFAFLDGNGDEEGVVVGKLPRNILEENVMALASRASSIPHSQVIGPVSDISNKPTSSRSTGSVSPLSHGSPF